MPAHPREEKKSRCHYTVTVPYVTYGTSEERIKWVKENITRLYTNDHFHRDKKTDKDYVTYYFESIEDSIIFKLRWG